ncbi:MAG TPA: hypothetical protein DCY17_03160, partial [Clostridiales bacterium]|nr:hypothetical protein [Clostridiales bacterium]
ENKVKYHAYLDEFLKSYIENGKYRQKVESVLAMIRPYFEIDPTSGVTAERFDAAVQSDMDFIALRAESIRGQLNGEIPTTRAGQAEHPETLVDCSGFVSPDSASLVELLLPKGSGLYIEDLVRTLVPQTDVLATVSIIPIGDLLSLVRTEDDGSEGMVDKLMQSGRIGDIEALEAAVKQLALRVILAIIEKLAAFIALAAALMVVIKADKNNRPRPIRRKERAKNAV